MRIAKDSASGTHRVRHYAEGSLTIGAISYTGAIVVTAANILPLDGLRMAATLDASHAAALLGTGAHIILVGTGRLQHRLPAAWVHHLLARGVSVDVMSTPAACRTFNVLLEEGRDVAALLIPGTSLET